MKTKIARKMKEAAMDYLLLSPMERRLRKQEQINVANRAKRASSIMGSIAPANPTEANPKHLSGRYRNSHHFYSTTNQVAQFQQYIAEMTRQISRNPNSVKLNPRYRIGTAARDDKHTPIGFAYGSYEGSTHSRVTSEAIDLAPELLRRCEGLLRSIPADTVSPETRATREWAQWILDTPARVAAAAQHSAEIAYTRSRSHALNLECAARNSVNEAISRMAHVAETTSRLATKPFPPTFRQIGAYRMPVGERCRLMIPMDAGKAIGAA